MRITMTKLLTNCCLKLDESLVLVKTIFGFTLFSGDRLSCFFSDLTNEQPFSAAYGKRSARCQVTSFSFLFIP